MKGGVGLFGEDELDAARRAARRSLGSGPTRVTPMGAGRELAPYAAALAVVPLTFVLWRRDP